ncbi:cytochrome P450 1B1 [Megalops cyprinoides]|uniref:cytochrome P450 1B1 n=1 Tax=Megalops cyprinoides TaxID=118141 RepID=UPI001863C744|nr:cytochrome P450 1B1 [Megalops cyprinoides]
MELQEALEEMSKPSPRNLLLASASLLVAVHLWLWIQRCRNTDSPPGPFPWPVIGNAVQLGSAPHIYFTRMAKKYGEVFQIKLGSRVVVVLNGEAIRTALIKKGADFAGRPDFTSFRFISNGKSMAFGNYNDWWKVHRKVAQTTVRTFSTSNVQTKKAFENHVVSEARELLHLFMKKTKESKYFQPHTYLIVSTANIMSAVCFGKRYSYNDAEFQQVVGRNDQFTKTVGAGSIVDVMPWLQYFPNPIKTIFGNFKALNKDFYEFISQKVLEHRKTIQSRTIRDMTDAFIVALDQGMTGSSGVFLGKEYVPPTVSDIFGASQDTLSTALQWIILILVRFPDIQRQLQEEVDKVVDRSRLPTIEDQPRLPYIMAFIYEVMRFTSFVPVTIPHSTTTDTSILGYHIPKDTVVFINQWSVNHDPAKWTQPEVFDPLRFLDESGALDKDLTSSVLIFSMGKRRCIGEDLSKMQLFLYTTLLMHQCVFSANPDEAINMDYMYGLTLKPKPFTIAVTHRDSMALLDTYVQQQADNETNGELGFSALN